MNTMGVLLLAAATAFSGFNKPHAGGRRLLRPHAVHHGPPPAGGALGAGLGASGCAFGHPGCQGGPTCPGGAGMGSDGMGMGMGMGMGGMGPGGPAAAGRRFPNVRSQVFFVDPPGMKIGWQTSGGPGAERLYLPAQLTVPARYNFQQGYIYRLKLTDIPTRAGVSLYPTVEVAPSTPATDAYLTHNPIPAQFTEEDFDQVLAGNFVTKVIYLPDPKYQELAIAGVETLVSTRLEPGVDPVLEADRRGTILMIIRMGAIDLEMPTAGTTYPVTGPVSGGPMVGPNMGVDPYNALPPGSSSLPPGATVLPSGTLPPGTPPPGPPSSVVPLDAPVSPAPSGVGPDTATPPPPPPSPSPSPPSPPGEPAVPGLDDLPPSNDLPAPGEEAEAPPVLNLNP